MSDSLAAVYRARDAWSRGLESRGEGYQALVDHARSRVPFYRDLGATASEDLPVVDRSHYRATIERFQDIGIDPADGYVLRSSGTTGTPLEVTLDAGAWYAVNHHFFAQIRALAGLPDEAFRRGRPAVVFVSNKPGRSNVVRPLPSLDEALYLRLQLGEPAATARFFGSLDAPILYGKPTYLLDLRDLLIGQGAKTAPWRPRLLLVSGEPLYPDDRERLRAYFGAPIVNALASTEGGLIAATEPDGADTDFAVFGENVRLEVLRDDGVLGPAGSGELVVSNLVNRATVFLRYRSGDRARLLAGAGPGTQRLGGLQGRDPERLRLAGEELPTALIAERLRAVSGLLDYQAVAGSAEGQSVLRWVPDTQGAEPHAVDRELRGALRELLPADGWQRVTLERAARTTAPGGKKRRFVAAL